MSFLQTRWTSIVNTIKDINSRYIFNCMNVNVGMLLYVGVWPILPNESNRYLRHIHLLPIATIIAGVLHFFFSLNDIRFKLKNMEMFAEAVMIHINLVQALTRNVVFVIKVREIRDLIRRMDELFENLTTEKEREILRRLKRRALWFTVTYQTIFSVVSFMYALHPGIEEGRKMPGNMHMPYDTTISPYYELSFAGMVLEAIANTTINGINDTFILSGIVYVIALVRILKCRLRDARAYAQRNLSEKRARRKTMAVWNKSDDPAVHRLLDYAPTAAANRSTALEGGDGLDFTMNRYEDKVEIWISDRKKPSLRRPKREKFRRNIDCADIHRKRHDDSSSRDRRRGNPTPKRDDPLECVETDSCAAGIHRESSSVLPAECRARDDVTATAGSHLFRDSDMCIAREMESHIRDCAQVHQEILRLCRRFQEVFSLILFQMYLVAGTIICVSLFQLLKGSEAGTKYVLWLVIFFMVVSQFFFYCWSATELRSECSSVSESIFSSSWVGSSPTFQRTMQIMMMKTLDPVQLQATSFLPFSMDMFMNVMNSSYSYFSVMVEKQSK